MSGLIGTTICTQHYVQSIPRINVKREIIAAFTCFIFVFNGVGAACGLLTVDTMYYSNRSSSTWGYLTSSMCTGTLFAFTALCCTISTKIA